MHQPVSVAFSPRQRKSAVIDQTRSPPRLSIHDVSTERGPRGFLEPEGHATDSSTETRASCPDRLNTLCRGWAQPADSTPPSCSPGSERLRGGSRKRLWQYPGSPYLWGFHPPGLPHGQAAFRQGLSGTQRQWSLETEDPLGPSLLWRHWWPALNLVLRSTPSFMWKSITVVSSFFRCKDVGVTSVLLGRHSGPPVSFIAKAPMCKASRPSQKTSTLSLCPPTGPMTVWPCEAQKGCFHAHFAPRTFSFKDLSRPIQPDGLWKWRSWSPLPHPANTIHPNCSCPVPAPHPGLPALQKFPSVSLVLSWI